MKTKLILLIITIFTVSKIFAQTDSLKTQNDIENLNRKVSNLESKIETIQTANTRILQENELLKQSQAIHINKHKQLNSNFENYKKSAANEIDSIQRVINSNSEIIKATANELGIKIEDTHQFTNQSITALNKTVNQNALYWIIATLLTFLLGALLYLFLSKRIKSGQSDVETQIKNTKKSLEEESLKLDSELIKVFQKQLEVIEITAKGSTQEEDHSLLLKIADRLTAMETNLYRMDPNTKGLNNLKNLVKSTKENFNAKEYEIVEMLGKEYKEGMEVIATFIPSGEIEVGTQVITKVIKPQVNFKGQKIQAAQIEVSIGE